MTERQRLIACVLALAPLLHGIAALFPPLNHDVAAVLHWAQRLVAGERLYIEITDVNPPLIFWLSTLPAWLAAQSPVSVGSLYDGMILLLGLGSVTAAVRLSTPADRLALLAAAVLAVFALPQHSFGQREHLLLIGCLPYLILAAGRWQGVPGAMSASLPVAVAAALVICLKPHFLLVPALIEGALLIRRGVRASLRDAIPGSMIAVGLLYVGAALIFTPAYFTEVLPTGLSYYAVGDGSDWRATLTSPEALWVAVPLVLLLALLRGMSGGLGPVAALFTAACLLAGLMQAKGWDYHFLAGRGGICLLIVAVILPRLPERLRAYGIMAIGLAGLVWWQPFHLYRLYQTGPSRAMERFVAEQAAGQNVLWLGTGIHPQFPALVESGGWSVNWPMSQWLMGEVYQATPGDPIPLHDPSRMPPAELALWRHTVEALVNKQPRLIVVTPPEREGGFGGRHFDWLGWLRLDAKGAAALAHYRPISAPEGLTALIRVRTPEPPSP